MIPMLMSQKVNLPGTKTRQIWGKTVVMKKGNISISIIYKDKILRSQTQKK